MKKIFAIAWKDALIRFSGFSELLFFIILPIVFTFILGGSPNPGDADNRIRLVVVDQAHTSLSTDLVTELEKSTAVRPDVLNLDEAESQFSDRSASVLLIIPSGFDTDSLATGSAELELRQQPNNMDAVIADRAVQAVIGKLGSAINAAQMAVDEAQQLSTFESESDKKIYFDEALTSAQKLLDEAPNRVTVTHAATSDQVEYDPAANSSAGQLITWVFIPLLGLSGLFAFERQQGTLRRLLTTPTSKATFLLGAISGQVLAAIVQMTLLVLFGVFMFHLNWGREPLALAVLMVSFALAASALGTTLGTFVKTEGQASGLSIMLGMVMALMGGCWYPLELFPETVQNIVKVLPTTWAMQGLLDLVLRGGGLMDILPEAGVLLGFAGVFFVVGVMRFRYE
jgi:ABC-2 type transport system permease protein